MTESSLIGAKFMASETMIVMAHRSSMLSTASTTGHVVITLLLSCLLYQPAWLNTNILNSFKLARTNNHMESCWLIDAKFMGSRRRRRRIVMVDADHSMRSPLHPSHHPPPLQIGQFHQEHRR